MRKPRVFLLDEPLSNLDAKLRASTRVEIARIHARTGATMVHVTHDQVEAMTLGERIVVMRDGRIQQIDRPMVLYRQPANRFVAGFLASPAVNFIEGRIGHGDGGAHFIGEDGSHIDLRGQALPRMGTADRLALGLRPEHLQLADAGTAYLHARLDAVEPVGNEVFRDPAAWQRGLDRAIAAGGSSRSRPGVAPASGAGLGIVLRRKRRTAVGVSRSQATKNPACARSLIPAVGAQERHHDSLSQLRFSVPWRNFGA